MSNDVFDEDLMRELGLEPEDLADVKIPPPPQKNPVPPQPAAPPKPQPKAATVPPKPAASKPAPPPPKVETSFTDKIQAPAPAPQPASRTPAPADATGLGERVAQGIPVHLAAVVAKKSLPLREVVELSVGEVVDFKKMPDEPIDLVANGKLVAKAELVMIDGKIGARIVKLVK